MNGISWENNEFLFCSRSTPIFSISFQLRPKHPCASHTVSITLDARSDHVSILFQSCSIRVVYPHTCKEYSSMQQRNAERAHDRILPGALHHARHCPKSTITTNPPFRGLRKTKQPLSFVRVHLCFFAPPTAKKTTAVFFEIYCASPPSPKDLQHKSDFTWKPHSGVCEKKQPLSFF